MPVRRSVVVRSRSASFVSFFPALVMFSTLSACGTAPYPAGSTSGESGNSSSASGSPSGASGSKGGSGSTGPASGAAASGSKSGASGGAGATTGSGASGSSSGSPASSGKVAGAPAGPYTVQGATILDKNGNPHLFRGLDRPSLEWSCAGDIQTDEYTFMQSWGANVVRVSLNQDCWINDSANKTYNANYATTVDDQVQGAKAAGLDIILDLHWSDKGDYSVGAACMTTTNGNCQQDMADAHSVIFWQQLAMKYANDPAVLFELYNEPKIGSYMPGSSDWNVWLNGGSSSGFTVHGMQELYTTVRNTGAKNLIVIGGLNWSYDLTGIPSHAVSGTGIIYNTHPYQDKANSNPSGWTQYFGSLTANYPVIATEFGDHSSNQAANCNAGFDQSFIPYADGKASGSNPPNKMSWTAWAFYNSNCAFPSLLSDSNFDPNAPGRVVQTALTNGP